MILIFTLGLLLQSNISMEQKMHLRAVNAEIDLVRTQQTNLTLQFQSLEDKRRRLEEELQGVIDNAYREAGLKKEEYALNPINGMFSKIEEKKGDK